MVFISIFFGSLGLNKEILGLELHPHDTIESSDLCLLPILQGCGSDCWVCAVFMRYNHRQDIYKGSPSVYKRRFSVFGGSMMKITC